MNWPWLDFLTWLLCLLSLGLNAWIIRFMTTHWPANGFVKVPKELARAREQKHYEEASLSDRTASTVRTSTGTTRRSTARMRGRRMQ